jgi:hypothetical protein
MKNALIFSLIILFGNVANAQIIKKIPKELKPITWDVSSRSTGHRGYERINIAIEVVDTEGKGKTLKFKSNTEIAKVEISFIGVQNSKSTFDASNNPVKDYFFYLESSAYKAGLAKGYFLYFYVKGFDKPIWVCTAIPKN